MPEEVEKKSFDLNKAPEYSQTTDENVKNTDDLMFFNIMPKTLETEKILKPAMEFKTETPLETKTESNFFTKYKIYIIALVVLAVLGPAFYFLMPVIVKLQSKPSEELVINSNPSQNKTKKPTENPNSNLTTPKDWQLKYFGKEVCADVNLCGDSADPDLDGLTNKEEFDKKTDPNNKDSDGDGISDGDEVHIFATDPLNAHTANNPKYSDGDDLKNGYYQSKKMSPEQISQFSKKMKEIGLHQPTLTTLGVDALSKLYSFSPDPKILEDKSKLAPTSTPVSTTPTSTTDSFSLPAKFDSSLEARQERDVQRIDTIKKIQIALTAYFKDNTFFPKTKNFKTMYSQVKPYLGGVATNPEDPVNTEPFVYTYTVNEKADDFVITYFSEVTGKVVKKNAIDAQKESTSKSSGLNDDTRKNDLETLKTALLMYSQKQTTASGSQDYVFPTEEEYKKVLVPTYILEIPKDPKTKADYEYRVSDTFDTFTLKTILENPKSGTTGYLCNQEECREY